MKTLMHAVLALTFALAVAPLVSAHEGHDHKIMGTVAAVHDNSIDVKGTDGKLSAIALNEKTKILQGATAAKVADIKTGSRVVVTATGTGKDTYVAKEVRLAASAATHPAAKR